MPPWVGMQEAQVKLLGSTRQPQQDLVIITRAALKIIQFPHLRASTHAPPSGTLVLIDRRDELKTPRPYFQKVIC